MDEAAAVPTLIYLLLTGAVVYWLTHAISWFDLTGVVVPALVLLLVLEAGVVYEGARVTFR